MERVDVVVVGGGIVGLATAFAVLGARPTLRVEVLDKESRLAAHQSGHNSGVIHSGVYYKAGTLKARTVSAGRRALLEFCQEEGVPYQICGKVIVATTTAECGSLHDLFDRATASGVKAEIISRDRLSELEPHVVGVSALHVPGAGIVDYRLVCEALGRRFTAAGGRIRLGATVLGFDAHDNRVIRIRTTLGEIEAKAAVNCAGVHSARLRNAGRRVAGALEIVPFRGEYHSLASGKSHLVRSMVYPVADPRFPFLGPHFTRDIDGGIHVGPNAVLALAREGYSWREVDVRDVWELVRSPGFRRLVRQHWRTGAGEAHRSLSRRAFVSSLRRLIPDVRAEDLAPAAAGVRAQAVGADGRLVEDFVMEESGRMLHVLNAPSPAATASLEIGRMVAERTIAHL